MLQLSTEKQARENIYVIRLRGRLDSQTAREFETFSDDVIHRGQRYFILSAEELEYLSSAGIGALVRFARRVDERRGAAAVAGAGPEVKLLLEFFQLEKLLPMFRTREEARQALSNRIPGGPAFQISSEGHTEPLTPPQDQPGHAQTAGSRVVHEEPRSVQQTIGPKPIFAGDSHDQRYEGRRGAGGEISGRAVKVVSMKAGHAGDSMNAGADRSRTTFVEEERLLFAEPMVFACEQCAAHIRVYHSGRHMCPSCRVVFRVRRDGSASFVEKL